MSASETSAPGSESPELAAAATEESAEPSTPAPEPEPWTEERVVEWNRYYDLYVAAGILLLVFLGSIHTLFSSSLWPMLQTGRLIAAKGPITRDPFSYTMAGQPWVNIPWLFELANAQLFDLTSRFASTANPEQFAAGALTILNATLRVVTAFLLLRFRRPGPGLWWVAVCAGLALGGMLTPTPGAVAPIVPTLGGIAMPATVEPATWGLLFFTIELLLLDRAFRLGRSKALWGNVPLFMLWANVDSSFLVGLLVFAFSTLGALLMRRADREGQTSPRIAVVALLASAAACLVNPGLHAVYGSAAASYLSLLSRDSSLLSFFGPRSWESFNRLHGYDTAYRVYVAYYILLVAAGLLSFFVNRRRFDLSRFLTFVAMSVVWAGYFHLSGFFAVTLAMVLALNGQEWYLGRYGDKGRLGAAWAAWSIGGRAVTILVVFAFLAKGLTGIGSTSAEPPYGRLGINLTDFPFEAAEFLKSSPLQGNVLNTTASEGDALIWKAYPARKPYIDGRTGLYTTAFRREFNDMRKAVRDDKADVWKPMLDKYKITAVMLPMRFLDPSGDTPAINTFVTLKQSDNWIPFYDDGSVVMFGRADAPAEDLAFFRSQRLEIDQVAYRRDDRVPSPDRTPTPTSWLDSYFPNRLQSNPDPHVWAATRWMKGWSNDPQASPDQGQCLLAIREIRKALARNPDDPSAWRILNEAYKALVIAESSILQQQRSGQAPTAFLMFRSRQRASVLNYAIQASPPPRDEDARRELGRLNFELAQLYRSMEFFDLERDRLKAARDLVPADEVDTAQIQRLAQLDKLVDEIQGRLTDLTSEQQAGPAQRAQYAMQQGMPGIAIDELEEAESSGMSAVKSQLIDLYCQVGEPDRAFELFNSGTVNDPALSTGPGTGAYRQALANFLIGAYDLAAPLWRDRALPELRATESMQALEAGRTFLQGNIRASSNTFQELPGRIANQAMWEYELGLCMLEGGMPNEAGEHFEKSLKLQPDSSVRALLTYYLEKLGRKAPAAPADGQAASAAKPALPADGSLLNPGLDLKLPAAPATGDAPKSQP